ncbi:hypothetical protein EAE96_005926 [Botrytis aclada]|nr:hypothetical protein EAE96_005926 [Botrytis aclada]
MYAETKAQAGKGTFSSTIFSGAALDMNADTPYTDKDMIADARAMTADLLAMPENKIIDITTIDTECSDSVEYIEALTGAGSGITVLSGPKTEENSLESNSVTNCSNYFTIRLSRFKCHRKQSDSFTGPRNEIYWAVACGSDKRIKKSFKTGEYGSINSGDTRNMDLEYFKVEVEEFLAGHIECWEADDGGNSFYNRMVQTLKDISDFSIEAAVNANAADDWGDEYGSTGKAAAILTLVGICGRLVTALLEWLTNDDDLVFRREIAFTQSVLLAWKQRPNPDLSFMFDGGSEGKHELWLRCYEPLHFDPGQVGIGFPPIGAIIRE